MKKQLLAALLLLTLLLPFASAEEKTEAEQTLPMLELHQVNLGCADGYLIRFGNTTVLIDGGEAWPNKPERLFPQYLEAVGVTHVDVYIVTHWHLDHCMNVNYILERWGGWIDRSIRRVSGGESELRALGERRSLPADEGRR
ncbi:MAG: MBL fold metallo-hydrolase [Christensenellales bacterium]|nr:MBL fold metallo-hydrolase [Christensenellales bacterium]